eukprot:gene38724-47825_t
MILKSSIDAAHLDQLMGSSLDKSNDSVDHEVNAINNQNSSSSHPVSPASEMPKFNNNNAQHFETNFIKINPSASSETVNTTPTRSLSLDYPVLNSKSKGSYRITSPETVTIQSSHSCSGDVLNGVQPRNPWGHETKSELRYASHQLTTAPKHDPIEFDNSPSAAAERMNCISPPDMSPSIKIMYSDVLAHANIHHSMISVVIPPTVTENTTNNAAASGINSDNTHRKINYNNYKILSPTASSAALDKLISPRDRSATVGSDSAAGGSSLPGIISPRITPRTRASSDTITPLPHITHPNSTLGVSSAMSGVTSPTASSNVSLQ